MRGGERVTSRIVRDLRLHHVADPLVRRPQLEIDLRRRGKVLVHPSFGLLLVEDPEDLREYLSDLDVAT